MPNDFVKPAFPVCILAIFLLQTAEGTDLPQELIDCRAIASAADRLDCYDRLVDAQSAAKKEPAETGTAEEDPPTEAAASAAPTQAAEPLANVSPEALFGKNEAELRKSVQEATGTEELEQIEATISEIATSAITGYVVITLDNGQVWKQVDHSRLRLSDNDRVTIRRAAFGSFMLFKTGRKTMMRVRRIS